MEQPVPGAQPGAVGLPDAARACLFDLDGVLTDTASVHRAAWRRTFDGFLDERRRSGAAGDGEDLRPFTDEDYARHVDGKPRPAGVRDFLASRGIRLPEGAPDDAPDAASVQGLGTRKNVELLRRIEEDGVVTYDGSVAYVRAARTAGLRTAVVSSSANTRLVLRVTGTTDLFDRIVDGNDVAQGLRGKPAPDTFLAGAERLGVDAEQAVVFEDALSGVEAGRAGGFCEVVGVNRIDAAHAAALRAHGADVVVDDLSELLPGGSAGASA